MLSGLLTLNIELTSRCNKNCWMCGRRKIENDYPYLMQDLGDMDFPLLEVVAHQLPDNIIVQFHNNGEPLLYPRLKEALGLFENKIRCLDTNAKLLLDRAEDIEGNLESITISTFQDDPEWENQYLIIKEYLGRKSDKDPRVIIRVLGDVGEKRLKFYKETGCLLAFRVLHSPLGSFNYQKKTVVPEHGMCLEMLSHPAINRVGEVSICVRFDPRKEGVIGDLKKQSLEEIWNGELREKQLKLHKRGKRDLVKLCSQCDFWGIPRG